MNSKVKKKMIPLKSTPEKIVGLHAKKRRISLLKSYFSKCHGKGTLDDNRGNNTE
jgi:hypothetical protein